MIEGSLEDLNDLMLGRKESRKSSKSNRETL